MNTFIKVIKAGPSVVVLKGGSGSGNFGHEGRPGEVGGSGGGGGQSTSGERGQSYYRGVPYAVATSIKRDGIKRGDSFYGRPPSVYLCSSVEEASTYAQLMNPQKSFGIVEVIVPANEKLIPDDVDKEWGAERSFRIEKDISPEWVGGIKFYDGDGDLLYERKGVTGKKVYYPVIFGTQSK